MYKLTNALVLKTSQKCKDGYLDTILGNVRAHKALSDTLSLTTRKWPETSDQGLEMSNPNSNDLDAKGKMLEEFLVFKIPMIWRAKPEDL